MNWLEKQFWKMAIWILKRGYGEFCYFGKEEDKSPDCMACKAEDTIKFLKNHIDLI